MLASAEIGHRIAREDYLREEPALREGLLNAQYDLLERKRGPILVLISGIEGGGRGETANQLTAWMDPRHVRVNAFGPPTAEELAHPPAFRYWRALPPSGKIGVFMNAWYRDLFAGREPGELDAQSLDAGVRRVRQFERMLADEGVTLLKFWIHLSRAALKERVHELTADPATRWRVTAEDRRAVRRYSRSHALWEHVLRESSTGAAPWNVVEGSDPRYRNLTIGKLLLDAMRHAARHGGTARPSQQPARPTPSVIDNVKLIRDLDLSQTLAPERYPALLAKWQARLAAATRDKRFRRHALVAVFEGADAAGKGSALRRVTGALDARQYLLVPTGAPNDEERAHPYLWRFWRHVPARGGVTLFDRSWYGRVLVERIEEFCSVADWTRAYEEINHFEQQLADAGVIVVKFWLQISKREQLARFRAREQTSFKRFKITQEDWRNRKKWSHYERAVADMVDRTSTVSAPWTLVEADDKRHARIKVLRTLVKRVEAAIDR
ncbi:MAG: polyphosphate:AMP phosphotransferase [Betaproteobacteria bacterium]|nr:polyphosphate:AMP phosphotransferase [Betaproteobacteria bacterium]